MLGPWEIPRGQRGTLAVVNLILTQFKDVFAEYQQLPPYREHQIHLKEGTLLVNVRPYRYSAVQKNMIEQMVQEMLLSSVIWHNHSLYVFLIILVKKDGSWRMCIDYWCLNDWIVKDKFPILVIKDLLDELHGTTIFSKLDLWARYHQIRMREEDMHKMAFRMHEGHYEFLVMPFDLTNAPTTF